MFFISNKSATDSDSNGISSLSTIGQNLILTHPSKTDHRLSMETRVKHIIDCKEELAAYKSQLQNLQMKIQIGAKPNGYNEPYRNVVKDLVLQIKETQDLSISCEEFFLNSLKFGHVFAASGFRRSSEDNQLDWALIVPTKPGNIDVSLC